jgi:pimeloyl-ACP methyl ester carboxylesterase
VLDSLAAEREVVAVDLPGFGRSPALAEDLPPTPENLARAVISFWDSLDIPADPHVVGISLGGWIAIECGKLGRVSSVTALCPAGLWPHPPGPGSNRASKTARLLRPLLPLLLRTKLGRRVALSRAIHNPETVPGPEAARMAKAYAYSSAFVEASLAMRRGVITDLERVHAPVTIAWAEFDRLITPPPPGRIPAGVRQLTLEGCGHIPTWDDPEQVAEVVLEGSSRELPEQVEEMR